MSDIHEDWDIDDEDIFFDCGLRLDGQCSMAGSEDCDWDCPHSHGPRYAGSKAWCEMHDKGIVKGCECRECREKRYRPLTELHDG